LLRRCHYDIYAAAALFAIFRRAIIIFAITPLTPLSGCCCSIADYATRLPPLIRRHAMMRDYAAIACLR